MNDVNDQDPEGKTRTVLAHHRTDLARDRNRLANERTYLAWLRTGLAGVGGGIAIMRLLTFHTSEHKFTAQLMGALLVLVGIGMFIFSSVDYLKRFRRFGIEPEYIGSPCCTAAIGIVFALISLVLIYMTFQPG